MTVQDMIGYDILRYFEISSILYGFLPALLNLQKNIFTCWLFRFGNFIFFQYYSRLAKISRYCLKYEKITILAWWISLCKNSSNWSSPKGIKHQFLKTTLGFRVSLDIIKVQFCFYGKQTHLQWSVSLKITIFNTF